MYQPANLPLAIRFVATSFIVLCDAPEERIVATRHALKSKRNKCKIYASKLVQFLLVWFQCSPMIFF